MLSRTLLSALSCALLFTGTCALPSRTHCRCSITSTNASLSPPSTYHDSLSNPDTLIPTPSTSGPPDLCASLGPSLENLRSINPALYDSYVSRADQRAVVDATSEQKPLSTTVLLRLAASQGFQNIGVVLPAVVGERDRPRERIQCWAEEGGEAEAWSAYQVSWVTLVVLQVVIALVVIACVAEGVMIGLRWMSNRAANTAFHVRPASLRLGGEEKRLLAVPPADRMDVRSPGVEKKLRVYASPSWKPQRFFYVEDEDDEFNRPVM